VLARFLTITVSSSSLFPQWQKNKETDWGNADAICIPIPKFDDEDDGNYAKTTVICFVVALRARNLQVSFFITRQTQAVSRYLLGYEFNATVLVLTRTELHFLGTEKKMKLLEPLQLPGKAVKIVLHT
jgi:nucleosome binding factor SPN SPT16 subunit